MIFCVEAERMKLQHKVLNIPSNVTHNTHSIKLLGKGAGKKTRKSLVFCQPGGGGGGVRVVSEGSKMPNLYFEV